MPANASLLPRTSVSARSDASTFDLLGQFVTSTSPQMRRSHSAQLLRPGHRAKRGKNRWTFGVALRHDHRARHLTADQRSTAESDAGSCGGRSCRAGSRASSRHRTGEPDGSVQHPACGHAKRHMEHWSVLLDGPLPEIVEALTSTPSSSTVRLKRGDQTGKQETRRRIALSVAQSDGELSTPTTPVLADTVMTGPPPGRQAWRICVCGDLARAVMSRRRGRRA